MSGEAGCFPTCGGVCRRGCWPSALTATPPHVQGMLEAGAVGYVLKEEALETIEAAVRAAARGKSWLSPKVVAKVMKKALSSAKS